MEEKKWQYDFMMYKNMMGENENLLIKENNYTLHNLLHELSIFLNIIFRTPNKVSNLILYF